MLWWENQQTKRWAFQQAMSEGIISFLQEGTRIQTEMMSLENVTQIQLQYDLMKFMIQAILLMTFMIQLHYHTESLMFWWSHTDSWYCEITSGRSVTSKKDLKAGIWPALCVAAQALLQQQALHQAADHWEEMLLIVPNLTFLWWYENDVHIDSKR